MAELFTLKNQKDNFRLLAFKYHTLNYSIEILKNNKQKLKNNPILKHKLDNYLLMKRLSFSKEKLPFDIGSNADEYINNPNNIDLKNYMSICSHIVAKELDIAMLCSKVDLNNHYFKTDGRDLFCLDCDLTTAGHINNEFEKEFLRGCAKRERRIIGNNDNSNIMPIYNKDLEVNNLITVA